MFESILVITLNVAGIFVPLLIPAAVHAIHLFRDFRAAYRPVRWVLSVRPPRPVASRRAAPAVG